MKESGTKKKPKKSVSFNEDVNVQEIEYVQTKEEMASSEKLYAENIELLKRKDKELSRPNNTFEEIEQLQKDKDELSKSIDQAEYNKFEKIDSTLSSKATLKAPREQNKAEPETLEQEQCKFIAETLAHISSHYIVLKLRNSKINEEVKDLGSKDKDYVEDYSIPVENTKQNLLKSIKSDESILKEVESSIIERVDHDFKKLKFCQNDQLTQEFCSELKKNISNVIESIAKESDQHLEAYFRSNKTDDFERMSDTGDKVKLKTFEDNYNDFANKVNVAIKKKTTIDKFYSTMAKICNKLKLKSVARSFQNKLINKTKEILMKEAVGYSGFFSNKQKNVGLQR